MNEKPKSVVEDAQKTGGFLVSLVHSAPICLRLFSRTPGSMGGGYLFPGVLWSAACMGVLPQLVFREARQTITLLPFFISVMGWLWLIHMLSYLLSYRRGQGTYSHCTGAGWLNWVYPDAKDQNSLALASDILLGGGLAVFCYRHGDQMLVGWWILSVCLSFASHFLLWMRDAARHRQVSSALHQQQHWQSILQRSLTDDME